MKRKYILGVLLVLILGIPNLSKSAIAYETTEILLFGEYVYFGIEMNQGDNLTWSFETFLEEFEVLVEISNQELSIGEISDTGIWIAPSNDTFWLIFINYDILLFRDGFIHIYFEVNVEPEPEPELPSSFILSSNAEIPDIDGLFTLTWTESTNANSYSVYQNNTLLDSELTELEYLININSNGSYSFKIKAFNDFGNTSSNEIIINVKIPTEPEPEPDPTDSDDRIGFNIFPLIILIGIITVVFLAFNKKIKRRKIK